MTKAFAVSIFLPINETSIVREKRDNSISNTEVTPCFSVEILYLKIYLRVLPTRTDIRIKNEEVIEK